MATQTFTFSGKAGDGKTLQVDVSFTCSGSGVGTDAGLGLHDLGAIHWKYDIDNLLLVPATVDVTLIDTEGNLEPWFTDVGLPGTLESERIAKITIKYNGNTEYIGYMIPETLEIYSKRLIKFKASPRIDILNEYMMFNENDVSVMAGDPWFFTDWAWYNVTVILEKIYQYVNSGISLSGGSLIIDQDWIFSGYRDGDNLLKDDFTFSDIKQNCHYVFFDRSYGHETLADALRKYAADWGCFTGMLHEEKAFFRKFYYYNATGAQTLTGVITHKKTYFNPISYVKITDLEGNIADEGTYTTMAGKYIDKMTIPFFTWTDTNIQANYGGDTYWIRFAEDSQIWGSALYYHTLLAKYWHYVRGDLSRSRIDEFECHGLNFDFLKSTNYDGFKYQIIEMEKDYLRCKTKIKALFMGAV